VRAYSHLLGHSGFTFLAASAVAAALRGNFPASLDGRPILMPTESAARRRNLEGWFGQIGVRPFLAGEFEDISLLRMFASEGMGIMPAATWVEKEVRRQFNLKVIGATNTVRESFYAISPERRITHPAVALLCAEGQKSLRNNGKSP
jgi:LysR family transcriptional activator of nhaA